MNDSKINFDIIKESIRKVDRLFTPYANIYVDFKTSEPLRQFIQEIREIASGVKIREYENDRHEADILGYTVVFSVNERISSYSSYNISYREPISKLDADRRGDIQYLEKEMD